jgi:hypothetical protein
MSKIAELKSDIQDLKELIEDSNTPKEEVEIYKETVKALEKSLEMEMEKGEKSKKSAKAPAKKAPKKESKKSDKKDDEHVVTINGKPYDVADCREAIIAWKARAKQSKESSKEYQTKPIVEKVTDNLKTAVKQATEGVSDSRIENKAKEVLQGAQMVEKAVKAMFEGFEKMTGKKIADTQRKQILAILMDIKEEAKENV